MSNRRGFTLIELLVVIAIIAILAAIIMPVFARVRERARQTSCLSNIRQLSTALQMYMDDHDEALPGAPTAAMVHGGEPDQLWTYLPVVIDAYVRNEGIYFCPSDAQRPYPYSYAYCYCLYMNTAEINAGVHPCHVQQHYATEITYPSEKVVLFENSFFHFAPQDPWFWLHDHEDSLLNAAFGDGHAKAVKPWAGNPTASPFVKPAGLCDFNYTIDGPGGKDFGE